MKLSRRLIPAFAMLLVSAVLMSTASFAWFSINADVTAQGMSITATADSSLVIKGSEDTNFTSVGTNELKAELNPVSSADGVKFAALKQGVRVQSTVSGNATWSNDVHNDVDDVSAQTGYVLHSTYDLKNIGGDVEVYVKNIVTSFAKVQGAPETATANGSLEGAIRVAIYVTEGNTDEDTGTKLTPGTLIFDPETVGELEDGGKVVGFANNKFVLVAPTYDVAGETKAENNTLGILEADKEYVLHILVWIEGQDKTCVSTHVDMSQYSVTVDLGAVGYTAPVEDEDPADDPTTGA